MKHALILFFVVAFSAARCAAQWKDAGIYPNQILAFGSHDSTLFASLAPYQGSNAGVFRYAPSTQDKWIRAGIGVTDIVSFCSFSRYLLAGNSSGRVYRTTDNGDHWSWTVVGGGSAFAISGGYIFTGGDGGGGIFRSSDTGLSWTLVTKYNSLAITAIGSGIISSGKSGCFYSPDYGLHWMQSITPTGFPWCLVTLGTNIFGGAGTEHSGFGNVLHGVIRSTDTGATWKALSLTNRSVATLATDGKNLFAGTDSGIYVSIDSGMTWHAVNDGLIDVGSGGPSRMWTGAMAIFDTMIFVNINNYIDGGGLWSTLMRPISEMVPPKSGVKTVASIPALDSLEIFPNPASGLVTIRGSYSIARVSVLNVLGAEVLNVPSVRASELTLDLSHFASGTYFLRIETAKGIVMRKIVREQ